MRKQDEKIIVECLRASANGPFFPDWEFQTLFGLGRSEVRAIAETFSSQGVVTEEIDVAVSNSMNNLLAYPHGQDAAWSLWISVSPSEVNNVLDRWQSVLRRA